MKRFSELKNLRAASATFSGVSSLGLSGKSMMDSRSRLF